MSRARRATAHLARDDRRESDRASERDAFGSVRSIDRPIDRRPTDSDSDLIFIHSFVTTRGTRGARERTKGRMATTMAAKEIEALTIASMASRDAVRAMRARGRRGGWSRERERERERGARRRAWRLRSVGFKRMHARECMNEEREGWLTDGVNARRRETIGVRDVEDRWRPERGGTRDTHGRAGGVGGD